MARHNSTAILSIPSGQSASGTIQGYWGSTNAGKVALDHAAQITVKGPPALTGVVKVQVAQKEPSVAGDFADLQSPPGTDVAIAAGKQVTFQAPACKDLRLNSAAAEGAQRDFEVTIQEDIND